MILPRLLLLLLLCLRVGAEETNQPFVTLKMTDGRSLVGYYDSTAGTLTTIKPKATIRIKARDISEILETELPKVEEPKENTPSVDREAKAPGPEQVWYAAHKKAEELRKEAAETLDEGAIAFLKATNLKNIKTPVVSTDPRKSEVDERKSIDGLNQILREGRSLLHDLQEKDFNALRYYNGIIEQLIENNDKIQEARKKYGSGDAEKTNQELTPGMPEAIPPRRR